MNYLSQDVGLLMQVKDKKNDGRINQLAIGAFIAFVGLTIVIITQLKIYDFNTITILLILMFLVLIYGFWGKSIKRSIKFFQEERNQNKLAKFHFKEFKNLVVRFSDFTENRPPNIQMVMKDIKDTPPFSQITRVEPIRIQELYKYYNKHLDHFNRTGDGLIDLVKEFESILFMYDEVYIKEPIKQIKNIGSDKVHKNYIESYNKAQKKYTAFIIDYNKFAKIANEEFGGNILFRDSFEPPEDL